MLKKMGFLLLSAIEAFKFKFWMWVKALHIKSGRNTSADDLSWGIHPWLALRGVGLSNDKGKIIKLLENPALFWKTKSSKHSC